ncbi:MAG TPA: ATP-binding protein [Verrucomicrobiae bacterium]|nr:ATP-binding protein [Verrucomicrobiae bacterium]
MPAASGLNVLPHDAHKGRAGCLLRLLVLGLLVRSLAALAAEATVVHNLRELQAAVQAQQHRVCDVDLQAVVCATDPARGLLVLADATSVEACALNLAGRDFAPGDQLHIVAPQCELVRRPNCVALATTPVVDNGGVHSVSESSGRITLAAGMHPLRLYYFNVKDPAALEVSYRGPDGAPQRIPDDVLFLSAMATNGPRPGLEFFCYDDTPATLDQMRNQAPIYRGFATNFDIALRRPTEDVAMQFRGLIAIAHAGEYEFTVKSDDGAELYVGELQPDITKLGTVPAPVATLVTNAAAAQSGRGAWQTLEGTVTFAGKGREGLELVLNDGLHPARVWLASNEGIPPGLLLNGRVRATGVCRRVLGPDGGNESRLLSVVGAGHLRLLDVAPEQWEKAARTEIARALTPGGREPGIVHLRGTVQELNRAGTFQLHDASGGIAIQPADLAGLTNGLVIDVLGTVTTNDGARVTFAVWRPVAAQPSTPQVFTTAAQVQQLSAKEAARQHPVVVRGVITCLVEWGGAVVQDDTRGVFFSYEPSYQNGFAPGDYAEIQGVTAVGDFAPVIEAKSVRVLGPGQMPEPVRPSWNQLMSGSLDSQYAEVRGIVTEVAGNRVTLLTESGKIRVTLHNLGETALRRLLNTLVRIHGCLLAEWDSQTRQVRVGEIRFRNPTVEIDQLPMADPFAAPEKTISDLLLFDLNASGFERVKIAGQIVQERNGEYFLMQDGKGLRFRLAGGTASGLQAGDLAEVVGIPELSGPVPRLHEAVARQTGTAPLPPAVTWTSDEPGRQSPDATRVQTEARLIGIHRAGVEWVLELQAGLRAFRARLNATENLADDFPLGSRLQVAGVYATLDDERNGDLTGFELLLNTRRDIQLLERPPWWTLRRLLYIVASLVAVLAMAAIWISQLRRQVAHRTQQFEREHARREHAERERALEMERSRIARDLHDDLGSSLTEIRVLASTGLRQPGTDARTPTLFQAITEKARALVSALDVIVWAVNPEANSLQSLADYLSGYAADYLAASGIVCRFKIPVSLPDRMLDGQVRHDLFLAVKEALHNVVRHSGASEVEFQLEADVQGIRIVITDNGRGFEPGELGAEGHGLRNLPERLARTGGTCEIASRTGAGTRVTIFAPVPDQAASAI